MRITNPIPDKTCLEGLCDKYKVPGYCIGIIRGGTVTDIVPVGVKRAGSPEPVKADTTFEAASITKSVFACMCTLLEIPLDKPVCELYREEGYTDSPFIEKVTPRMILSHGAGLPNWSARPVEFCFEPGTSFGYSGEGYYYLQRAIEHLTGESFPRLARKMLLSPLGMNNSEMVWTPHIYELEAVSHDACGNPIALRGCIDTQGYAPEPNAAWSLYTTAADFSRFMAWFLENRNAFCENAKKQNTVDETMLWGLGFGIPAANTSALWHWGDNGGYKNMMAMDVETLDGVCVFSNGYNGNLLEIELLERITDGQFWQDVKRFIARW